MNKESIYFNKDHEQFRLSVKAFIEKEAVPHLEQWEQDRKINKSFFEKMGAAGLLGLRYSEKYGGSNKDIFYTLVLLEELGLTGYAGFRIAVASHIYMSLSYLALAGSEMLKDKYLRPAILGKKIAALAITEETAGSDLSQLNMSAVQDNRHYILNGSKKYIVNGTLADFAIVIIKTGSSKAQAKRGAIGLSLIIVDTKTKGLSIKPVDSLGMYSTDTAEFNFNNVTVPQENIIGKVNNGFLYLMKCLQFERLIISALAVGGIEYSMKYIWQYISKREMFNTTISQFQTVRHKMAKYAMELNLLKEFTYHTAWLFERSRLAPMVECSTVKIKATDLATRIINNGAAMFGANGYKTSSTMSRLYRDTYMPTFTAGSNDSLLDMIAQLELDENL